ncbi:MAG TPA: serine/threonine-protein kinase [Bryobacteraceae bacterium]|nr:serine/threonine-protein kinase [Bryobacteraceae bacterium]
MERIEGEPLIDFANSRKLSLRQRLELFRQITNAVQYAHQNLIVHRDLKPGNILVSSGPDGQPSPKLLDFGIAKLLNSESARAESLTATGFQLMTPDYASPEQVQGKPVTVASDVYSLGAVLYELLTGVRPHGLKSYDPAEIAERICSQDIPPPSSVADTAVRAVLRGDLDTIVLKAMHKNPDRRYNSAEQFSEDVHRYLRGMPVLARPDTTGYRVRKFVGRHWIDLAAAAAVAAALSIGAAVSIYQARLARNQARVAQERFELVRTLASRFLFDFHAEIENLSGTTKAQQMVVNTAVEYLDKLSRTAGSDRALLKDMAEAYARLAKAQGAAGVSNAGRHEDALASQRRSVEVYRRLAAIDPANRLSIARSLFDEAHLEENLLQKTENLQHSRDAVQILDGLVAANPQDVKLIGECGMAHVRLSAALRASGELDQAPAATLKAQEYFRATLGRGDDLQANYRLAVAEQNEAEVRVASGDVEMAIFVLGSALRTIEEIVAAAPANRYYQYLRIQHLELLEEAYYSIEDMSAGDFPKAVQVDRRIRNLARDFLASDRADNAARMNMAMVQVEGVIPLSEIDPGQAVEYGQSALALFDQALKSTASDQFSASRKARAVMIVALADLRAGRLQDALTGSQEAADTFRGLMAKPDGERYQRMAVFGSRHRAMHWPPQGGTRKPGESSNTLLP